MKTNRNFWRVLVLALALVMMFAIVACAKDGDEAAATTEAAGSTAGSTEAETTTAKATTEPKQTTATTEPKATTEPASTEPATTEPLIGDSIAMPSQFDNDGDGKNDSFIFYKAQPELFKGEKVITINGADYIKEGEKASVGVKPVTVGNFTHYYLDFAEDGDTSGNVAMIINWEFEVAEAGYYEMCIQMRMKNGSQRGNIVYIDDKEICKMDFQFTEAQVPQIQDNGTDQNSWMAGFGADLTAGKHILSFKGVPSLVKTFHTRYIYLVKVDAFHKDLPTQFDNNGNGKADDFFSFYSAKPELFNTQNTIVVAGGDHDAATSVGVKSLEVGNFTHYYLDFAEDGDTSGNVNMVINWKVNIPEDGYYEMCIQMRMKDGKQRGNIVYVDDKEIVKMDFQFAKEEVALIQDNGTDQNSWMTGFGAELTKGEHTISFKGVPTLVKTFHTRYIYLTKTAELSAPATPAA